MKKVVAIIVSILFVLSVTGLCFAQAAPAGPDKKVEDKAKPEKKAEKKADKKKVEKKAKKAKKAKAEKKDEKKEAAPAPEKK